MSTLAKAEEGLDLALAEYKRCKYPVTKALQSPNPNERTINTKMQ